MKRRSLLVGLCAVCLAGPCSGSSPSDSPLPAGVTLSGIDYNQPLSQIQAQHPSEAPTDGTQGGPISTPGGDRGR